MDGASPRGLTDPQGQLLDGNADGQPGGNYAAPISWREAVLPAAWKARISHPKGAARSRTSSLPRKVVHPAPAGKRIVLGPAADRRKAAQHTIKAGRLASASPFLPSARHRP